MALWVFFQEVSDSIDARLTLHVLTLNQVVEELLKLVIISVRKEFKLIQDAKKHHL